MKTIALNCNECGAPLDVPESARFVTCSFCESRLSVEQTGNTYSTVLLEKLTATTEGLADEVRRLRAQTELASLDREWEQTRDSLMIQGQNGRKSEPSYVAAAMQAVVIVVIGSGASSVFGEAAFLMALAAAAVIVTITAIRAEGYKAARSRYNHRRQQLMDREH